jgi:hypothetical protein
VPQGDTKAKWVECAEYFADGNFINFWGIPRNVVNKNICSRRNLSTLLHALNPNRTIHMLGFSDDVIDDIISAQQPWVTGIDSAVPIRAVSQGIPLTMRALAKMPPRGDWWETATWDSQMAVNLKTARQWFR